MEYFFQCSEGTDKRYLAYSTRNKLNIKNILNKYIQKNNAIQPMIYILPFIRFVENSNSFILKVFK